METDKDYIEKVKEDFKELETVEDLVNILNFISRTLNPDASLIYKKSLTYYGNYILATDRYYHFEIPKKRGGTRGIYAPNYGLKKIQKVLSELFHILYYPTHSCVGFVKGKSIKHGAMKHVGMRYVYNIDLQDFFPSIHLYRVKKCLTLPPFNLDTEEKEKLAYLIANLCCISSPENDRPPFLPQGAPTSPILSNIICRTLDRRLNGVAKKYGLKYTRYADDMTFSSLKNVFQPSSECIKEIHRIIKQQNFQINQYKVHLAGKAFRQMVTGLVVNTKVNVPHKYISEIRSLLYFWDRYGYKVANDIFKRRYYPAHIDPTRDIPDIEIVLKGKINYLKLIRGENDELYKKNSDKFETLYSKKHRPPHHPKELSSLLKEIFSQESSILKYSTHRWDKGDTSYSDMIDAFINTLKKYEESLKKLDRRLFAKIYAFIATKNKDGVKIESGGRYWWGKESLPIGWRNENLKNWCEKHPKDSPFDYPLPSSMELPSENFNTFEDIVNQFKQEIECRKDINQLKIILTNCKRNLFKEDFEVHLEMPPGVGFYTNIEQLEKALDLIINGIKVLKQNSKQVRIRVVENESTINIYITHIGSDCNVKKEDIRNLVKKGDFQGIYRNLISVADWAIETKLIGGEIIHQDYLYANLAKIENKIPETCEGFTHILTLYK